MRGPFISNRERTDHAKNLGCYWERNNRSGAHRVFMGRLRRVIPAERGREANFYQAPIFSELACGMPAGNWNYRSNFRRGWHPAVLHSGGDDLTRFSAMLGFMMNMVELIHADI